MYDALLFLHVLAAFAMATAIVLFTALVVAGRRVDTPPEAVALFRISRLGEVLIIVGSVGTLVLGLWLAIYLDAYHPWDGWIVAALVLWAVAGWSGGEAGKRFERDPVAGRAAGIRLQALSSLAVLVILILMIWKPGA